MRLAMLVALAALTAVLGGCGDDDTSSEAGSGTVSVFAASSLTDAFEELRGVLEAEHPDVHVELQFGASSTLARQVNEGAPADVIATADERTMDEVVKAGNAKHAVRFTTSRLVLVVEPGNPLQVHGIRDLARADVVFVACAVEVPCGALAREALDRARVTREPASLEENVRAVLSKVTLGEADAGFVYATDAHRSRDVERVELGVEVPDAVYRIALTTRGSENPGAAAWVALVRSAEGQRVLRSYGFVSA